MDRIKKTWPITDDYKIFNKEVLGDGVSGKVVACTCISTGEKFALKVNELIANLCL